MKRILTIQDISCLGKCSITIALPVISALGTECVILPTAVLSNHTLFKSFTCKDLSDQIEPICEKWIDEDVKFDGVYTGYLGTIEQIEMMKKIFKTFGKNGIVFVDPVMADNGKLYPAFDMDYAKKNAELCAEADIIVPNITEASIMTGMEYKEEYDESYVKELLAKVSNLGAKISVLTGVSLSEGKTGVMGYDKENDEVYVYQNDKVGAMFHGTGDLFSSTVIGAMMSGKNWKDAMRIAANYTAHTIEVTMKDPKKPWYGVNFEETIPELLQMAK
jgi:pyridoxine kinase